jgi:hypothetical protein
VDSPRGRRKHSIGATEHDRRRRAVINVLPRSGVCVLEELPHDDICEGVGLLMSDQAKKFLAQWEFEHIKVVERSDREEEAQRLALRCQEDAAKAGIGNRDLEAVVENNLVRNMLQALDAAEFRQISRDQWADEEGD